MNCLFFCYFIFHFFPSKLWYVVHFPLMCYFLLLLVNNLSHILYELETIIDFLRQISLDKTYIQSAATTRRSKQLKQNNYISFHIILLCYVEYLIHSNKLLTYLFWSHMKNMLDIYDKLILNMLEVLVMQFCPKIKGH